MRRVLPGSTLLLALLTGCKARPACTTQDLGVRPSPGDDLKAIVYTRTCGPEDATLNISLVPRTEAESTEPGNLLVLRVDLVKGVIDFPKVGWDDESHLRVSYDSTLQVITKVARQGAVSVLYNPPAAVP